MRSRSAVARNRRRAACVAAALGLLGLLGCGGASAGGASSATSPTESTPAGPDVAGLRYAPTPGTAFAFERTSRGVDGHDHVARGTWTPTSAIESALHVSSNGESWSHDADAILHFDARGLVTDGADRLEGLPELDAMTLVLAPVGAPGVALPLESVDGVLRSVVSLAPLAVAGFPAELPVTCTLAGVNGGQALHCVGTFESPPTERHPGWLVSLAYHLELDATLDAHGVALRSVQHVTSDVTQQQLSHVEHEGGESTITTVLTPL